MVKTAAEGLRAFLEAPTRQLFHLHHRQSILDCRAKAGAEFAEAHHLKPLRRARRNEKTRLEDLVTVCANCHRMLHLMSGREHDLQELKDIIKKQRRMN